MTSNSRDFGPIDFKTRFPALDGLRALAVTMVFVLHYGGGTHGGMLVRCFNALRLRGWIGVDLFFVLSGFLITGILYDTRTDSHYFKRFFARRSLRIFPVFYLSVVIILLLTPIFHYQWRPGYIAFLFYLGNFAMTFHTDLSVVVAKGHPDALIALAHLWSLCVEEQFYLIWPLVVWLARDRVRLLWISVALCVVSLLLRIELALQMPSKTEGFLRLLPYHTDVLLFGAILALLLRGPRAKLYQSWCKWVFLGCGAVAAMILAVSSNESSPWVASIGLSFVAAASAGLIGSTLRRGSASFRLFHLRPLRILGKYSYGFYVYHLFWQLAWVRLSEYMATPLHSRIVATTLVMATNALVTFLVAKLSYDLFEVRFLRFKTHFEYDSEVLEHQHAFTTK